MAKREPRLADDGREEARSGSQSARLEAEAADELNREEREDEAVEDRELTDDERFALFQGSLAQSVLPKPPNFPGYHCCWLTTKAAAGTSDTIENRLRLGYKLVRIDEVRDFKGQSLKSGEYPGIVSINEMVLAKLPLRLYNRYMREVHERMPLSEEEKIRMTVEQLKAQAGAANADIRDEGDGTAEIVNRARPMPEFME